MKTRFELTLDNGTRATLAVATPKGIYPVPGRDFATRSGLTPAERLDYLPLEWVATLAFYRDGSPIADEHLRQLWEYGLIDAELEE